MKKEGAILTLRMRDKGTKREKLKNKVIHSLKRGVIHLFICYKAGIIPLIHHCHWVEHSLKN